MKKNNQLIGVLFLLLAAVVWGFAFVAQSKGMDSLTPAQFCALRFVLGSVILLPVVALSDFVSNGNCRGYWPKWKGKKLWLYGLACGTCLGVASMLQQWGMIDAEAGKAGFLTVLYIIGVPIFGVFVGRKSTILLWIAVAFAVVGSYFLCNPDVDISKLFSFASSNAAVESVDGSIDSKGWQFCDTLLILCAVAFTFHILVIDKCVQFVDAMRVATVQSLVAGVIALIVSIVLGESWSLEHVLGAAYSILYCAACSTGIGYSCQFLGQRSVHPVAASLIMSLESVFAAIGGYLLLGERMETMELWGCAIIFVAVILAQIPTKSKS